MSRFVLATAAICASSVVYAAAVQSPGAAEPASLQRRTVWDGVYSEAQAFRGEKVADTTCIGCHGPNLDGGDSGPRLVGSAFLENWSTQPVAELFEWVREAMPSDAPGTLSKDDTAAVLAYILKLNKMPAGKQSLPSEGDELTRILIVTEKK
jgi:mono/diheme cytochrome c family protein